MIKKGLLVVLCMCLAIGTVGCAPEAPRLDVTEGYYDQEFFAKIVNLEEGQRAYYTLDGSEPGQGSNLYTQNGIPLIEGDTQVNIVKINADGKSSKVLTMHFTVAPQMPQLATPDGVYNAEFSAVITNLREGYKAYYTLDGSEPNANSSPYTKEGIPLTEGENQIKVIKFDESGNTSDVLTANLSISPYEPDYSNYFTKLHKQGNTIYYVQNVDGYRHSSFREFTKLYGYNLADGSSEVVLDRT